MRGLSAPQQPHQQRCRSGAGKRSASRGYSRGKAGNAVCGETLKGLYRRGQDHNRASHKDRSLQGEAKDHRHREIGEEMLDKPMQPQADLPRDWHERIGCDRGDQNRAAKAS